MGCSLIGRIVNWSGVVARVRAGRLMMLASEHLPSAVIGGCGLEAQKIKTVEAKVNLNVQFNSERLTGVL
jgi:hypothetical protein